MTDTPTPDTTDGRDPNTANRITRDNVVRYLATLDDTELRDIIRQVDKIKNADKREAFKKGEDLATGRTFTGIQIERTR